MLKSSPLLDPSADQVNFSIEQPSHALLRAVLEGAFKSQGSLLNDEEEVDEESVARGIQARARKCLREAVEEEHVSLRPHTSQTSASEEKKTSLPSAVKVAERDPAMERLLASGYEEMLGNDAFREQADDMCENLMPSLACLLLGDGGEAEPRQRTELRQLFRADCKSLRGVEKLEKVFQELVKGATRTGEETSTSQTSSFPRENTEESSGTTSKPVSNTLTTPPKTVSEEEAAKKELDFEDEMEASGVVNFDQELGLGQKSLLDDLLGKGEEVHRTLFREAFKNLTSEARGLHVSEDVAGDALRVARRVTKMSSNPRKSYYETATPETRQARLKLLLRERAEQMLQQASKASKASGPSLSELEGLVSEQVRDAVVAEGVFWVPNSGVERAVRNAAVFEDSVKAQDPLGSVAQEAAFRRWTLVEGGDAGKNMDPVLCHHAEKIAFEAPKAGAPGALNSGGELAGHPEDSVTTIMARNVWAVHAVDAAVERKRQEGTQNEFPLPSSTSGGDVFPGLELEPKCDDTKLFTEGGLRFDELELKNVKHSKKPETAHLCPAGQLWDARGGVLRARAPLLAVSGVTLSHSGSQ